MKNNLTSLPIFDPDNDSVYKLPETDGWPEEFHQFEPESINAIQAAFATGRPLLVRGEPGTGKSQLARAVAHVMDRRLLCEVITSKTEVNDLLWNFDAVARLGEAQIQSATAKVSNVNPDEIRKILSPEKFIQPGKVWWAIDWKSALQQARLTGCPHGETDGGEWKNGCVLLIDEIDKADSELPNGLLECFANRSFQVPYLLNTVRHGPDQPDPLVVITTNEERELPPAFLRRCLVLHLNLPKEPAELKTFLTKRGHVHFEEDFRKKVDDYDRVLETAADQLIIDRADAGRTGLAKPGQAEYIDLCRAVFRIAVAKKMKGEKILASIASFSLKKNPVLR